MNIKYTAHLQVTGTLTAEGKPEEAVKKKIQQRYPESKIASLVIESSYEELVKQEEK